MTIWSIFLLHFNWLHATIVEIIITARHIIIRIDQFHEIFLKCAICEIDTIALLQMTNIAICDAWP